MCGFLLEISPSLLPESDFRAILNKGHRRGPDSQGIWSEENIHIGFNRLAILELSEAGNQPMQSNSGRWVICFNGESYNHLEIRKQLGHAPEFWKGHSDTESILAAIEAWGVKKAVERLDGMFAMALWDRAEKDLYLIRDFAGIKPLWFGHKEDTLVAASQYDQVAAHPAFKDEPVNAQVLSLYLEQHYVPAPFGLFRHTAQIQPGEIRRFHSDGRVSSSLFWQFPEYPQAQLDSNREKALEAMSHELEHAVQSEMLSDVPLGAFLSGGIDSPLVSYFAQRASQESLKTFTIGSDSTVHDESEDASKYARLIGTRHTQRKMNSGDALNIIEKVMQAMHEPMADFSLIPTWLVSGLAREQVTVALSGDGGDELFFGYERFESVSKNYPFFGWPYPLKYGLYGADKVLFGNKHLNSALLFASPGMAQRGLHSRFSQEWRNRLFPDLNGINGPEDYSTYSYTAKNKEELLHQMRRAEFYGMMQKTLRKVDLASMEHSLEVRVPFLSKRFIEHSLQYPIQWNFGPNKKKQMLKDILRSKLPESPIDQRKRGFSIPLTQWIREDLYPYFSDHLLDSSFTQAFGIHRPSLETMLLEHKQGKADHKWPLFTMLALGAFFERVRG